MPPAIRPQRHEQRTHRRRASPRPRRRRGAASGKRRPVRRQARAPGQAHADAKPKPVKAGQAQGRAGRQARPREAGACQADCGEARAREARQAGRGEARQAQAGGAGRRTAVEGAAAERTATRAWRRPGRGPAHRPARSAAARSRPSSASASTARVYRAVYEALDQVVALKVLREEIAENPILVERFHSEAKAIAKVDNENVLKIYDVGTTDGGLHYMVVELLEGEEILDLIHARGARSSRWTPCASCARPPTAWPPRTPSASCTATSSRRTSSCSTTARSRSWTSASPRASTTTSERVGTPHYMAPEVCDRGAAEPASDIYGLGIVLYHLLVGNPPYAGKNIQGILKAHMAGVPLRPERDAPGTPKDIGEIVRHLTKHDPAHAPDSQADVVDELDAVGGKELKEKESLGPASAGAAAGPARRWRGASAPRRASPRP